MIDTQLELNWELLVGTVLCFLCAALCAGSGIGGGSFYVAIYTLLLGMDPHTAVPLSKVVIFGVAIGGCIVNMPKRHPTANRPLIDYDTVMVMEPMTLAGTVIGVYLNIVSPAYVILICLVLIVAESCYSTLKKTLVYYKAENEAEKAPSSVEMESVEPTITGALASIDDSLAEMQLEDSSSNKNSSDSSVKPSSLSDDSIALDQNSSDSLDVNDDVIDVHLEERERMYQAESKTQWFKLSLLTLHWAGMLVIIFLKGGTNSNDKSIIGVTCGSLWYWIIVLIEFPYLIAFAVAFGFYLQRQYRRKQQIGYLFHQGDIEWTTRNTLIVPSISVLAGVAAAFLGVGGGMVKGPLLLAMKAIPQVAVTTSSFMILFTSSSTSIQFIILGKIDILLGIWYFFIGLVGSILGNYGVGYMVKRYKKQSYVGFLLTFCLIFSAVILVFTLVIGMIRGTESMSWSGVCTNSSNSTSSGERDVLAFGLDRPFLL
eukprot:TRINITY_DN7404_c0_g1_i1.p1 TRINITY_DN7404_c0_g1~~TRINITY_DN7404_c0_g1_i1.p1  ORF type:complete len:486 (+),score=176.26 TRINITY_DN7404_c0_g1_i1:120-1577(+)